MKPNPQSKRKYNIVYLIDVLGVGGAERMMVPILQNLSRDDFSPSVCVFRVKDGNPIANDLQRIGVPVDFLPIPYLRYPPAITRLWRYVRDKDADLVHTQLEFADTLGNFVAKLHRLPSVSTIHTLPSQDMSTKAKAHQQLEWFSLRKFCNRVIAVSNEARAYHLQIGGARENQMITIYNGIDMTIFDGLESERDSVRHELGIPQDAQLLTTVAVLREPKGIQFMLQALPKIIESVPQAYYLIVGDGPYANTLRREADKLPQRKHIIFAGMRKDVPRCLAASDIFVLPTLTEALPTVLAEAMASRLPIVASAVGGVPEMITNGQNGFLVAPSASERLAEACLALLSNTEHRQAIGARGWQIAHDKFDIRCQVEQLKNLYLELIAQYEK